MRGILLQFSPLIDVNEWINNECAEMLPCMDEHS
jgi:hypothetical protein